MGRFSFAKQISNHSRYSFLQKLIAFTVNKYEIKCLHGGNKNERLCHVLTDLCSAPQPVRSSSPGLLISLALK